VIAVYTGASLGSLHEEKVIHAAQQTCAPRGGPSFPVTVNTTYYIAVDGTTAATGGFALQLDFVGGWDSSVLLRKKASKDGTAELTVDAPGPGTVDAGDAAGAAGHAAVSARRRPRIKHSRVRATAAGPATIKIRPSRSGMKKLEQRGRLKVRVKLSFTPDGGSTPISFFTAVTLKLKH
jgi:hypothetical protein